MRRGENHPEAMADYTPRTWRFLTLAVCIIAAFATAQAATQPDRQVAITIDDLPAGNAAFMDAATITDMTSRLLAQLREQKIPAVGFVNETKLYKWGEVDERAKALAMWLDSGFELGNHTFSHTSLNRAGLKAFEDDVIQGEPVIRLLLAQHKMQLRYFRHPYLDVGLDLETRREAEAFLSARGYRVAPVTVDAWDWMYARVYDDARKRGDAALQQQLVSSYLSYTDIMFAFAEQLSKELVGYEIKQVLLLHANQLEADHLNELAELIRKRGYRFISLEDALSDQAYSMPDTYVGQEGTDWLDHWAITRGKPAQGHPVFPAWVIERDKAIPRPAPMP
jgi:peptidoglycan/xylan/chitin deacetylase (PgdA/CDA1 family)